MEMIFDAFEEDGRNLVRECRPVEEARERIPHGFPDHQENPEEDSNSLQRQTQPGYDPFASLGIVFSMALFVILS
jgi:hypothetical protein